MKNLKKLISVVLSVVMIASFLTVGVSAVSYPDVEETAKYSAAVELLSALDILKGDENGNFNPDAEIKRSEFAAVICRALGQENAATSTVSSFTDVAAEHWAVGYIGWAAGKGIVNGYGDGTFGPDKAVSYQEAVKMVMAALGYTKLAEKQGGYPYGYLSLAGTYGVTAGLSANPTDAAPRSLVAQLVYNALEAPIVELAYTAYGEQYIVYNGSKAADGEEKTILSQYLDIIKVRAKVKNNYMTDTNLWKKNGRPMVELDLLKVYNDSDAEYYEDDLYSAPNTLADIKVYEGETKAADYLAQTVEAYLFFNEDENLELKAVVSSGKVMDTLEVSKDIAKAEATASPAAVEFEYWVDFENDSEPEEVEIATDATVYVNGESKGVIISGAGKTAFEELEDTDFPGKVEFVGTKGDAFSDVFITKYDYAQVERVDLEDEYIVFGIGGGIELSKEARNDDNFVYTIYKNGEEIALEDIAEGDVLSIAESTKSVEILVSSEKLTGTVTGAKSNAASNRTFYIDKVEYVACGANILSVGDAGTFYLTADGKVYSAEATSTISDNYGFVLKVGSTESFNEKTWQIRLFTKEGTTETYTVADTVKVSTWATAAPTGAPAKYIETSYKRADGSQDTLFTSGDLAFTYADASETNVYNSVEKRLITYTLDGTNITKITIASNASIATANKGKVYDVKAFASEEPKPATDKFAGYIYTDATKLFYAPIAAATIVPTEGTAYPGYTIDEDKVALLSTSSLDEEQGYNGYTYAMNADKEFGAAVITSNLGFAGKGSALAVVISTAEGLDANGEKATTITVLRGGKVESYVVNEDADEAGLLLPTPSVNAGDIIQITLNGVDEVSGARLVFTANNGYDGTLDAYASGSTGEVQFVFGIVKEIASKYITLGTNSSTEDFVVKYEEGCTFAKVDMAKISRPDSAITKASSVSSFRATKDTYTDEYVMVARVVDEEIVDIVSYEIVDDNNDGVLLNGGSYDITLA